jgi:hypothetical protein
VVGDRQDLHSSRDRSSHDLFERRLPVARDVGVDMEVADDVADGLGERSVLGRFDLAGVFAPHGGDEGKPKGLVDLLLGRAGDDAAPFELGQRVFVEGEPAQKRALP